MWKGAFFLLADSRVGIVWTFIDVPICALFALFAIAKDCKIAADGCSRCDANMCVAAFRV
jgi:hypothetical protein